jgi:hypothetical protein
MPNRRRDSKGRFKDAAFFTSPRDNPGATAALAAGIAGAAAAGAFLWSRRAQIGEALNSGMDRLSEYKSAHWDSNSEAAQEDYSEEALTLKETGKKSKGARGPIAQQDIKAGMAAAK